MLITRACFYEGMNLVYFDESAKASLAQISFAYLSIS